MSGRGSRDVSVERNAENRSAKAERDPDRDRDRQRSDSDMDRNRTRDRAESDRVPEREKDRDSPRGRNERSPPPKENRGRVMDESSRQARWTSLLKSKLSFGFHHLSPAHLPIMTEDRRAYALCFEKVSNWHVPDSVLKAFGKGDYEITLQLSLSLYHLNSASFFGSTWMGPPISLGNSDRKLPTSMDFEYADVVYFISRIADPTCVAVIEIVASKYDSAKDLVVMQFGCGWTMINLFSKPYPVDIADDPDRNNLVSCSIFSGSPRDLVIHPDMKTLTAHLKEVPDCALFLKVYSHRQILKAQRYVSDNEAVGRFDPVAGLLPQVVIPPGETRGRLVPCIGSEEFLDAGKVLHTLPAAAKLVSSLDMQITNCQVFIPKRETLELRMIDSLFAQYRKVNRTEIQVLKRTLKIGLHNGHTIVDGHWSSQGLQEDKDDRDMLFTDDAMVVVPHYVPDAYMALVFVVEYQLGVLPSRNNHIDSHSILEDKSKSSKVLSVTTVGVAMFIPCDGKRIVLANTQRSVGEEGVNVEVKLFKDELSNVLNPTHLQLKSNEQIGTGGPEQLSQTADAKVKNRLSYISEEKLRASTNLRASTATENLNLKADVPNNLGAMIGLDLKLVHFTDGPVLDGAYVEDLLKEETRPRRTIAYDDEGPKRPRKPERERNEGKEQESISSFKPRSSFRVTSERFERPKPHIHDQDERESVAESIVTGDSEQSHVRLNSMYYSDKRKTVEVRDREDEGADEINDYMPQRRGKEPPAQSDLLMHSMNAKLTPMGGGPPINTVVRQTDRDYLTPQEQFAERFVATKSVVPLQRNEFFIRPMSRGAKTRLNRHGIADVVQDTADYYMSQQQERAIQDATEHGYQTSIMKRPGGIVNNYGASFGLHKRVDVLQEADDELSVNEINLQFVGYRAQASDGGSGTDSAFIAPRAIYCTYQLYACQSTRTEALLLQPADPGAVHVLCRDDPSVRNEAPLVLRYVIDLSKSSPYECYEYAEYLAHKSLYIDVWDADSLLYLGTVGVPCRLLMRQGAGLVKHALEVDIINGEATTGGSGGITNMTILDNGPLVGERVGSLHLMLSCQGIKGRAADAAFRRRTIEPPMAGLNWRAHGGDTRHPDSTVTTAARPKTRVRARPLTETAPELSEALSSLRDQVKGVSFRSLSSNRGGSGMSTLNYDEVIILFKRFAGDKKGTVQYSGELMLLMDLPSMSLMMKKLIKAFKTFGDQAAARREILRHANSAEELSDRNLEEFFRVLFDKTGIKSREEDRLVLSGKIVDLVGTDKKYITASKLLSFISEESDKLEWSVVSTRIKLCVQRALLQGVDVEQLLCEHDATNSKYISVKSFKEFLTTLSSYGKMSYPDINLAVRIFSRHGRGVEDRLPVSLQEVLAFLGIDYVGNLQARIRNLLSAQDSDRGNDVVTAKFVVRLLNDGQDARSTSQFYPYDQVIGVFRSLGVYSVLSHEQVMVVLKKLDVKSLGKLSAEQVLGYLGLAFKASDLANAPRSGGLSLDMDAVATAAPEVFDAEQLLKLLLDKVRSNGVAVDEAFRHFDTNGDGFISPQEFEQGLTQLAIFDHIPGWKSQLSQIVTKFDKSNDGLLSLREFFAYLGIKDYAPNIVQRLTKIFAVATVNGLSFQDIFVELDENKDGTLDAGEIVLGLQKLGTFGDISETDARSVVNIFDDDGDSKISLNEFVAYFQERVAQDLKLRRVKNGAKVAKRFREVMSKAQAKGASIRDIFAHFDKDKGGSVNTQELSEVLRKLPNLKALSAQDITDLIQGIDVDNSGDVTLDEFETFVNGSTGGGPAGVFVSIFDRIRQTFAAAETKGLSFEQAFSVIDKDGNCELSVDEFGMLLRKLPTFRDVSSADVKDVFDQIDTDRSRTITVAEFKAFVKGGHQSLAQHKENLKSIESIRPMRSDSQDSRDRGRDVRGREAIGGGFAAKVHLKEEAKELFLRHMRRISEVDGSLRGLLAYLDDDEDGLIRKAQLFNLLRREDVFDSLPREEVEDLLTPFVRDEDYLVVVPLLRFLEGEKSLPAHAEADNHLFDDLDKAIQEKDYGFSRDPEVRAVEKKLRLFGRTLAKKGVDVEQRFQQYDPLHTGVVQRTDFIQVLAHLGIYLLEEGRILQDNAQLAGGGNQDVKRLQVQQINRLKGYGASSGGQGYVSNIPRLARKVFETDGARAGASTGGEFKSHLESLTIIDWYRQGQKQMLLQRVLSHSLAHTIHLYPRFGKTLFFEYPLSNPFNHEERFEIEIDDPELRLVTGVDEWQHLRQHCRPCVGELGAEPAEAETFDRDGLGRAQATLLPFETFSLPFTFMTLLPYSPPTQPTGRGRRGAARGERKDAEDGKDGDSDSDGDGDDPSQRVVEVKVISGSHGHLVAILRVHLHVRAPLVHRVLRFQEYEHSIAKRHIKLVAAANQESFPGDFHRQLKYLHCVETSQIVALNSNVPAPRSTQTPQESSRVVVEWGPLSAVGALDDDLQSMSMLIRYKCGAAPTGGMFYILIYNDPFQSVLHEVWQVMVYSRLRLDVQSMVRSPSAADLVVRGDQYSRRVRAYASSSAAYGVAFKPENVFQLVPGAYNRVLATVQPKVLGSRRALINLVDADTRELVSSWLLNIAATAPAVSRIYDVAVPASQPLHKKILFKNPWDSPRRFVLLSSDETVMRPRVPVVEVAPHSSAYLRLWFSAWKGPPGAGQEAREVHLFLNDAAEGQNEECHLFRVRCA